MRGYRDLKTWQEAMELVKGVYVATRHFPRDELYGLTSQLRRAAVSIPSNIAEGQARFSSKEFAHFLSQARGSLVEIETQILIAQDLGYLSATKTRLLTSDGIGPGPQRPDRVDQRSRTKSLLRRQEGVAFSEN